jgi:hypothetical protein
MNSLLLIVVLFLINSLGYTHLCHDPFRPEDRLILIPEAKMIKMEKEGEFRIYVENTFSSVLQDLRLFVASPAFEIEISPTSIDRLVPGERSFYLVKLRLREGFKAGDYPLKISVAARSAELRPTIEKIGIAVDEKVPPPPVKPPPGGPAPEVKPKVEPSAPAVPREEERKKVPPPSVEPPQEVITPEAEPEVEPPAPGVSREEERKEIPPPSVEPPQEVITPEAEPKVKPPAPAVSQEEEREKIPQPFVKPHPEVIMPEAEPKVKPPAPGVSQEEERVEPSVDEDGEIVVRVEKVALAKRAYIYIIPIFLLVGLLIWRKLRQR